MLRAERMTAAAILEAPILPEPRRHPSELFVDLFCGFGGVTAGAKLAARRLGFVVGDDIDFICVNHNTDALAGHKANNPDCEHVWCDLETKNPREVLRDGHLCDACANLDVTQPCPDTGNVGREITGMWTSAPCKRWSPAANAPYSRPQERATPDYNHEWRRVGRPTFVVEENVKQIMTKWDGWAAHIQSYRDDGYHVEHRVLNAADYGVPQGRHRLILIAVRKDIFGDGPIPWAESTHADPKKPKLGRAPWRSTLGCLDLSEWSPSFFDGKKDQSGKPTGEAYSQKVRARIARYIRDQGTFWHPLAQAVENFTGKVPLRDALDACPPQEWPAWISRPDADTVVFDGFVGPDMLVSQYDEGVCRAPEDVSMTLTTAGYIRFAQVRAILPGRGPMGGPEANPAYDASQPSHVVLAGRRHGNFVEARLHVAPPAIVPHHGEDTKRGQPPRYHQMDGLAPTVPASRALDAAFPFIVTYNGKAQADDATEPSTTVTCRPRHSLVTVRIDDCWFDLGYRQLTVRETAAIQGFHRDIKLVGSLKVQQRGIGNAVPPPLAEAVILPVYQRLLALRSVAA